MVFPYGTDGRCQKQHVRNGRELPQVVMYVLQSVLGFRLFPRYFVRVPPLPPAPEVLAVLADLLVCDRG